MNARAGATSPAPMTSPAFLEVLRCVLALQEPTQPQHLVFRPCIRPANGTADRNIWCRLGMRAARRVRARRSVAPPAAAIRRISPLRGGHNFA